MAWFFHHRQLCEPILESPLIRIKFIQTNKKEDQQAIRLRCFRPIKGKLLKDIIEAQQAYATARLAFETAFNKHIIYLTKLMHKELPGCPWDGETLFPQEE